MVAFQLNGNKHFDTIYDSYTQFGGIPTQMSDLESTVV